MNWTFIGIAIAAIGTILAIVTGLTSSIDKKIKNQINNPDYIRKVAEQVRLPFIIFDENERFLNVSSAEDYVEKIKVLKNEENDVDAIIIVCKRFLDSAPILQSIDGKIQFHDPERVEQKSWKFKAFEYSYLVLESTKGSKPPNRFKLEIIP